MSWCGASVRASRWCGSEAGAGVGVGGCGRTYEGARMTLMWGLTRLCLFYLEGLFHSAIKELCGGMLGWDQSSEHAIMHDFFAVIFGGCFVQALLVYGCAMVCS